MSVARGTLLNLLGHVAPLIAALAAVPLLVTQLEPARFGFLSLAWVIVGYFGLFDLGLGRALTRLIAERMGTPREPELPVLARTALLVLTGVGSAAGVLLASPSWRLLLGACNKPCTAWARPPKRPGRAANPSRRWPMPCPICRPLATPCWPGYGSM